MSTELRFCAPCNALTERYPDPSHHCKPCTAARGKRYRATPGGAAKKRAARALWLAIPEKRAQKDAADAKRRATPEGCAKKLIRAARANSNKRGHQAPTIAWQDLLPALIRGTCAVSGLPLDFSPSAGRGKLPLAPSLDRLDASKPYTKDNFRVVCWALNAGCSTWGLNVYLRVAAAALAQSSRGRGTVQ